MTQKTDRTKEIKDNSEPSFNPVGYAFSVLPEAIMDDERLSEGEIILFARLMSLVKKEGYCWATNEYLSQKCRKSKKTISRYLTTLEECGYIRRDVVRNENRKVVVRKIFINTDTFFLTPSELSNNEEKSTKKSSEETEDSAINPPKKDEFDGQEGGEVGTPAGRGMDTDGKNQSSYLRRGMDTRVKENNTKEYITEYINNNSIRPRVREALLEFCEMRFELEKRDKNKPFTKRAFKMIVNRLNELSQNDEDKIKILNNSVMNNWQGIFPLHGNYPGKGKETDGMKNGTYDAYFNSAISN